MANSNSKPQFGCQQKSYNIGDVAVSLNQGSISGFIDILEIDSKQFIRKRHFSGIN
jgi:hypothetical protein